MAPLDVVIVGAGAAGLAAAIDLARAGARVTVLERAREAGGKIRSIRVGGAEVDAGPTVLTMRWVFDELFHGELPIELVPARVLARHAWPDGTRFDLSSDPVETREAIGQTFGAAEARGYDAFRAESERAWSALRGAFIERERPGLWPLARSARGIGVLPFRTMWSALGRHFRDARLRQLFGRYATYCGSSPFFAPATLNVIAHVESLGVHRVTGGMRALARAMRSLAEAHGARFTFGADVRAIRRGARMTIALEHGALEADVVIFAGDASALPELLGDRARRASRSFSAVTFAMEGRASGFSLVHHNVLFSDDYPAEMNALARGEMPERPTVYACAQDRADDSPALERERVLLVLNAPPTGDEPDRWREAEIERWQRATFHSMERCGLRFSPTALVTTTPADFHRAFPCTGGAIYGPITHGALAPLSRFGTRGPMPGLYLAGGSVHPGAGVPMATISGRLAAARALADHASTRRSAAIAGTTSTA